MGRRHRAGSLREGSPPAEERRLRHARCLASVLLKWGELWRGQAGFDPDSSQSPVKVRSKTSKSVEIMHLQGWKEHPGLMFSKKNSSDLFHLEPQEASMERTCIILLACSVSGDDSSAALDWQLVVVSSLSPCMSVIPMVSDGLSFIDCFLLFALWLSSLTLKLIWWKQTLLGMARTWLIWFSHPPNSC